jgi:GNAT superfamily N-acetyltransferase
VSAARCGIVALERLFQWEAAMQAAIRTLGEPGDLGWVVQAHGETYAAEYGWDRTFEALVARIVADFAAGDDPGQAAWVAELDGRRVGCCFCVRGDDGAAVLRLLLVAPEARGHRLGTRLVATCLDFARSSGYQRVRLWTNDPLQAARRIYLAAGFSLVESTPHHSFGADLVGQVYQRELQDLTAARPG